MNNGFLSRLGRASRLQRMVALIFCLMLLLQVLVSLTAHAAEPPLPEAPAVTAAEEAAGADEADGVVPAEQEAALVQAVPQADTFPIKRFVIYGYTKFPRDVLKGLVDDLRGSGRTEADVQAARDRLEKHYHDNGYPTTFVNIPEQSIESGFVYLQIVEGKVGTLTVKGNSWRPEQRIRREVPSLATGAVVSLPQIRQDLGRANSLPDVKVVPALSPGKETGTTDVELTVEDRMPFHGSMELNNRNSLNTSSLRLNAMLRYDDLWGRGHSLSFQYQTSPEQMSEVQVFSGSYTLPVPGSAKDRLVLYGVRSDSESGFGEGFKTLGNGSIVGVRYVKPFTALGRYNHYGTFGFDYKQFKETGDVSTEITYLPFSLAYGAVLTDDSGLTRFNAGLNVAFRGMVTDNTEFGLKRSQARGNYIIFTPGLERTQRLPAGLELRLKLEGQLADQPLIANEQYAAGGMESVRGYYESESSGDNAVRASVELVSPDLARLAGLGEANKFTPYLFFDYAALHVKKPLTDQTSSFNLQGTGLGVRGLLFGHLDYQVDGAFALRDADSGDGGTRSGNSRVMFRVKGYF
jgi:hemolysin activation/secretion protein